MNIKAILLALLSFPVIAFGQDNADYTPKFENKWAEVNDTIKANWKNYSGDCGDFPNPIAYAMWCGIQFYWDTYFTQLGLLSHNEIALAKGSADNLMWMIDKYQFIPNANADWGDNRSQPPYFSMMVKDLYPHVNDTVWLRKAYSYLLREYDFWTNPNNKIEDNSTPIKGLQRYFHHATKEELLHMYDKELTKRFSFSSTVTENEKLEIASNFAAEAETGMDFTTRFENRCSDFIAVDLNSNLYLYEQNFAWMEKLLQVSNGKKWEKKAKSRKKLINKYCWDQKRGFYLDYDFKNKRLSKISAATGFSPLYAGVAAPKQAKKMAHNLTLLEKDWGIVTTEYSEQKHVYQWDHISIWAPLQAIVILGLDKYGFQKDAQRIAKKYLDLVSRNFYKPYPNSYKKDSIIVTREPFKVYEKFTSEGEINDREYKANTMWGWSAGTWGLAYKYINK